jgi:NTE family protein
MKKKIKIGLALGSGGARGLAHIGVLKALKREDIDFEVVAGTSFGALIGGMYAVNSDPDLMEQQMRDFILGHTFKQFQLDLIKLNYKEEKRAGIVTNVKEFLKLQYFLGIPYRTKAYTTTQKLAELTDVFINEMKIEEARIRFAAVATDLIKGQEVVLDKGNMREAVRASCAIPGIFPPMKDSDRLLVDGAWVNRVPVDTAIKLGAECVIAVNVSKRFIHKNKFMNGLDILIRANDITSYILSRDQLKRADVIIEPEVGHFHWTEFGRFKEIIALGVESAEQNMQLIKNAIAQKKKLLVKKIFLMPLVNYMSRLEAKKIG